ncbi:MAG: hypothetical protein AAFN77_00745 [Planctomycetota bacterium]
MKSSCRFVPPLLQLAFALIVVCQSLCFGTQLQAFQDANDQPAAKPEVPLSQRAVDYLYHDGKLLVGLLFDSQPERVSIAVDRHWLKTRYADEYPSFLQREETLMADIIDSYKSRFAIWIDEIKQDEGYAKDLELELGRILDENTGEGLQKKRFILLRLDRDKITKLRAQPVAKKRIAALAWDHELENVSNRSLADLQKSLRAKKVNLKDAFFDLSSEMPAVKLSDRQWLIRRSMFEFEYTGEMEFQGQGDTLFAITDDFDMNQVMARLMGGSQTDQITRLGRELGLPEFAAAPEKDWVADVTRKADNQGTRSVLVKRLLDGRDRNVVTVETTFLAKTTDDRWEKVVQFNSVSRLSDQSQEDIDAIKSDPRVQAAVSTVQKLGLGNGAGLLDEAIRKGAATKQATDQANEQIRELIGQNARRIEVPWTLD